MPAAADVDRLWADLQQRSLGRSVQKGWNGGRSAETPPGVLQRGASTPVEQALIQPDAFRLQLEYQKLHAASKAERTMALRAIKA